VLAEYHLFLTSQKEFDYIHINAVWRIFNNVGPKSSKWPGLTVGKKISEVERVKR
jgi:hypothetical protein